MALSWFKKLKDGLNKTSENLSEGFKDVFVRKKLDDEMLENLEEVLISSDMGIETALSLTEQLRQEKFEKDITEEEVKTFFAGKIAQKMLPLEKELSFPKTSGPKVILMVGVNGSGKTTTTGKLSKQLSDAGHKVMLAAGDTFRAGAVEQLDVWAKRNNLPIVKPHKEGADPASVIFKAYEEAKNAGMDYLIADTAGRLQNRKELMDELEKVIRVLKKQDETAPHATLLVLDATVGQNAHMQTEAFKDVAGVTGLIMTKLDSTAKGGVLVALADKHNLPIHFIGIGESVEDLRPFNAEGYANALLGIQA
ncbi:MAG: Signal recognition particle receptor FtsY [Proteobacteria bacterium]|nr:MAG: Signal recognition particle receptor FtsY [Pseudomonadota bacterium]